MRLFDRTIVAAAVSFATALGPSSPSGATDFCALTSQVALKSCQAGAQSDDWLALGKCDNIADARARYACGHDAAVQLKDAQKGCTDQYNFRQAACKRLGPAPYDPTVDPANFVTAIDNPFFPLKPGTTFVYEGQTAQGLEHNDVFVTHNTKVIDGVTCTEVLDTVKLNGVLTENTLDWYAQDKEGNVWYFGENSEELDNGLVVSLGGSFMAGVDGAKPGVIMEAHPAIGDFYRQEFDLNNAEDLAEVLSLSESVTVPAGSFDHCLETQETEALDPSALEHKFYAAGKGNVLTVDLVTGERLQLLQITTQ